MGIKIVFDILADVYCHIDRMLIFNAKSCNGKIFINKKTGLFFQFLYQVLSFGMIVSSALMIWKGLMVVTGSESPIVVVLR